MAGTSIKKQVSLWHGITSPDARWGIFAILLSFSISFGAFALSFYQLGGAQMTWVVWLFVAFGIISFVLAMYLGFYWGKHPREDVTPQILIRLTNIESSIRILSGNLDNLSVKIDHLTTEIHSLVNEIRQERDERRNRENRASSGD